MRPGRSVFMTTTASLSPNAPESETLTNTKADFADTLRRYWGYDSFRPGQEAVVRSIAAGRDACVVMPPGGGKTLCYQLPAVLDAGRTAGGISPLIPLIQAQ